MRPTQPDNFQVHTPSTASEWMMPVCRYHRRGHQRSHKIHRQRPHLWREQTQCLEPGENKKLKSNKIDYWNCECECNYVVICIRKWAFSFTELVQEPVKSDLKFHCCFKEWCRFVERKGVVLEKLKAALYDHKEWLDDQLIQEVNVCLPLVRVLVASKQWQIFLDRKNKYIHVIC